MNSTKQFLCIILLVFSHNIRCDPLTPEQEESLENFITSLMQCRNNIGMSVSLVRGGEIIFAEGFGYRDLYKESPMLNDTKLNIASISKGFTATLAADAIGRGLGDWETAIVDVLGADFELDNAFSTEQASLRDLMSHRLGLPSYWGVTTAAMNISRQELCMEKLQHFSSLYDFRSEYSYGEFPFSLAAYVTEVLTGDTWEEHIRNLFDEIGMSFTKHAAELTQSDWDTDTAYSYLLKDGQYEQNPEEAQLPSLIKASPAIGIFSSAVDMGLWMLFHLNGGVNEDGVEIIPSSALCELYRSVSATDTYNWLVRPVFPVDETDFTYGLGFVKGTYRGYEKIDHVGGFSSYSCKMTMVPSVNVGVWACTNSPGVSTAVSLLNMYALDLLLDEDPWLNETTGCTFPAPWIPVVNNGEEEPKSATTLDTYQDTAQAARLLEEYAGEYGHPGLGTFNIYLNETGQLRYEYGLLLNGELIETEQPLQMNMTFDYPLDYNMIYYPDGSPVYFNTSAPGGDLETVQIPYLEFALPPVFVRRFLPRK